MFSRIPFAAGFKRSLSFCGGALLTEHCRQPQPEPQPQPQPHCWQPQRVSTPIHPFLHPETQTTPLPIPLKQFSSLQWTLNSMDDIAFANLSK